jgi:hypothetical protein
MATIPSGSAVCRIKVAFAALHRTLAYRGEDTGLYVVAAEDGTMFFSRRQPPLYDSMARSMPMHEVLPKSVINVRYHLEDGIRKIDAVQIVHEAEPDCPFEPVFEAVAG